MRFDSLKVIYWYSLVCGIACGALLFAYFGVAAALLGLVLAIGVSYLILIAVRRSEESQSPYLKLSEQIGALGLIALVPLMLVMDPLLALLIFIGFAQLALLFQTHDYRRFYIGLMVSFVALIAGAVETKSGLYLVFFLAYAIAVSITLGYAHIEPRSRNRANWKPMDQTRASLWLIGVAVLIYLILPRLPAGNLGAYPGSDHFYENKQWEAEASEFSESDVQEEPSESLLHALQQELTQQGDGREATEEANGTPRQGDGELGEFRYQGFQQQMDINNPDAQGERFSNRIVARMRADSPLYLRARIFDRFDGVRWYSSAAAVSKLKLRYGETVLSNRPLPAGADIQRYEIFIEEDLGDYIAAAAVPLELNFPASVVGIDAFGQLRAPGALKQGSAYAVESLRRIIQGRSFAELTYIDLPGFTQLPEGLDPRIAALAAKVSTGAESQLQQAIALEQHLRNEYAYDFNSIFTSQQETPLSQFLFETQKGHCEYFASALAIMLRTQGIPARLVTGFSATNQNPLTGYYDIYALDGHAWVEAYVDDLGWVELEPTAYYDGPSTVNETLSAEQINAYVERQLRLHQTLGTDEISLELILSSLWQSVTLAGVWLGAYLKLFWLQSWHWLLLSGACLLMLRLLWPRIAPRWRALRIKQALRTADSRDPGQAVYHYLRAIDGLLRNAGYIKPAGLTIEQYLQRLEMLEVDADKERLSDIFNRIHYSRHTSDADPKDYRQLFELLYALGPACLKQRITARSATLGGDVSST